MDQNSTDGTDKRNWRERLGIGAKDGLPRASADFKEPASARSAAAPARPAASSVKPAPMAPRIAPRANPVAPAAPAPSARATSGPSDALAAKLRAQREAAEKLAEQRVNAARQRPEPPATEQSKPKFSFADSNAARPQTPAPVTPAAPTPPKFAAPSQQPARQQLGQGTGFKPVTPAVPPSYAQQPPQRSFAPTPPAQPPYQRQYTQPPYQAQPGYRPIDPGTGYAQPPAYVPPQQRPNYTPPAYQPQAGSRGQVPMRGPASPYQAGQADLRSSPRLGSTGAVRSPPQVGFEDEQDDIFEQPAAPAGRRATANDYQQAYRNAEPAYEDDLPRSRLPLILMILLVLALASGIGGIWAYNNLIKGASSTSAQNAAAPVVAAPTQPTKVDPDVNSKTDQASQPAAGTNKKQIYDRIIGDHEVLSGQMKANEEAPVQPDGNAAPPAPGDQPSAGTGDNGMPLPLPPPPGSSGGTQGSLEQNNGSKVAQNTTAAEPSSAALSTGGGLPAPAVPAARTATTTIEPPVPSSQPSKLATSEAGANTITDQPDPVATPPAKPVASKVAQAKKAATAKVEKDLGTKPVVLVPPADGVAVEPSIAPIGQVAVGSNNSLYNGPAVGNSAQPASPAVMAQPTPVAPKRKTLGDLFKSSSAAPATTQVANNAQTSPQVAASNPAGGFVAQLTSFKTKTEASDEYARLVKKHGAIISKYAPIIETAEVAGSPRFRLNIGPMATMEVATNICSSLFAAGERDCVVHRQ
jgi:hypothetical protein